MKSMSKIVAVVAVGLCVALSASANQIVVQAGYPGSPYGKYQTGSGGEFTIVPKSGNLDLSGYSSSPQAQTMNIGNSGGFQTFCVEKSETISPYNTTYNAEISDKAMWGSQGSGGDTLSVGTGWLYSQFASGTLSGYDYVTDNGRKNSARALQNAFWMLEEQTTTPVDYSNPFINTLLNTSGLGGWNAVQLDGANTYGVYALNLTYLNGARAQDQLYYAPKRVPDGGMTVALLGFALAGLAMLRRRI